MEEKKSYYAIIPASVRYDKRITLLARMLYGEITALCNEKGYCWASNSYFADLYDVSNVTISRCISQLKEFEYISVSLQYKNNSKEIEKRIISIDPIIKNDNTPIQKNQYPIIKNDNTPIIKNDKENITVLNITDNNTIEYKEKEKKKKKDIFTDKTIQELKKFYEVKTNNKLYGKKSLILISNLLDDLEDIEIVKKVIEKSAHKGHRINNEFKPLSFENMVKNANAILTDSYQLVGSGYNDYKNGECPF